MSYIIIPSEHLEYINFREVAQTNPDSLRYSSDGKYFLLKYKGEQPEFVFGITQDAIGLHEYTHEEILEILQGSEWSNQD